MVLSAIFPKGYSLVILFSTINPPFIVPYLSIGKLLIFSSDLLSIFLKIFKYLLLFFRAIFILLHSSIELVFLNFEIFSQRELNSV